MGDWRSDLVAGSHERAWDGFIVRYRPLIFSTIRHYARDYDDVMDVFARVCVALQADEMRRLRAYWNQTEHRARFSTWLVAVVRNLTIDWFRSRDGRQRVSRLASSLPELRRQIFENVFVRGRSHVETFELISSRRSEPLSYREYLRELRETYSAVTTDRHGSILRELGPMPPTEESPFVDPAEAFERTRRVEALLATLKPEDRAAVELYVIEEMPAADIARILGLPNAKAVYNRVYRALDSLHEQLSELGLTPTDI